MKLDLLSREEVEAIIDVAKKWVDSHKNSKGIAMGAGANIEETIRATFKPDLLEQDLKSMVTALPYAKLIELQAIAIIGRGHNGTERKDWDYLKQFKTGYTDAGLADYLTSMLPLWQYLTDGLKWVNSQPE